MARMGLATALVLLALGCGTLMAQNAAQSAPASSPEQQKPQGNDDVLLPPEGPPAEAPQQPAQQPPAAGQAQQPANQPAPANQPSDTVNLPPQGTQAERGDNGSFVFRAEVQEVTLHATVVDEHQKLVTTLGRTDFQVFEDGKPQRITSFRREDVPVAMGIVIDNSGSMRDKRPGVNAAALNLVRSSNPQDQVCIVNFNNEYYLDQDYTGDVHLLRDALERIDSRGGTALYDSLEATSDHLMKSAKLQKKVILVVTDGEDNSSRDTLQQAIRAIAVDGGPTIYAIGLLDKDDHKARRALKVLTEQTGGMAFFPERVDAVEAVAQQISRDIRNQYTLGYKPSSPKQEGGYRQVNVKAEARGLKHLTVRTRSGYYAGGERAANQAAK